MFYENVLKLCSANGISLTSLLHDELHMSTGNITRWKSGTVPNGETISKIASYFGISVDYLLGTEQKNKPATNCDELYKLNEREKQMLLAFRAQSREVQDAALRVAGVDPESISPKQEK